MKTVLISIGLIALAACGTARIKGDGAGQTIESKKVMKGEPAVLGYSKIQMDSLQPFTINAASIEGNTLNVTVQYTGGCEKHSFKLEGSEAISKSLPPIRNIRIVHTGKQDNCKAIVIKNLQFDLSEVSYKKEEGSEIYFNLEGYTEKLKYTYSTK